MLSPQRFARLAGDKPGFDPKTSLWVPADHRDVPGSQYAAEIATQVPDLRGMFLRGLNKSEDSRIRDNDKEPNGDNRVAGESESDESNLHANAYIVDDPAPGINLAKATGSAEVGIRIQRLNVGDANETRPKNVAIYYYIKIN
jgi:hypothetical protein